MGSFRVKVKNSVHPRPPRDLIAVTPTSPQLPSLRCHYLKPTTQLPLTIREQSLHLKPTTQLWLIIREQLRNRCVMYIFYLAVFMIFYTWALLSRGWITKFLIEHVTEWLAHWINCLNKYVANKIICNTILDSYDFLIFLLFFSLHIRFSIVCYPSCLSLRISFFYVLYSSFASLLHTFCQTNPVCFLP